MKTSTVLSKDNLKLLLVCLTFLVAFILILLFRGDFSRIDLSINLWVPSIQSTVFTDLSIAVSYTFDTYSLLAITVGVATYLFFKNHKGESLLLLGAMGGDALLVAVFKALVHSPRPLNELIVDSGYSFPSGHTAGSIVFCGLLAYFAWQHWKGDKAKLLLAVLVVAISAIVGFDRIYLNVHWFSDVLGGYMLGIFWLTFSILTLKYLKIKGIFQARNFNTLSLPLYSLGIVAGVGIFFTQWFPPHLWFIGITGLFHSLLDTVTLITTVGYVGLFVIVFADRDYF